MRKQSRKASGGRSITIGGIVIPSTDPVFLAVVIGVHIPLAIARVVTGASGQRRQARAQRQKSLNRVWLSWV